MNRLSKKMHLVMAFAGLASLYVLTSPVKAQDFGPDPNEYADYGHVSNGYTGTQKNYDDGTHGSAPIDTNGGFCGPTSVANSLQFLANKYGGVYDNLIDGNAETTRNDIVDLETLDYDPGTPAGPNGNPPAVPASYDGPANNSTIFNSKVDYIDSKINPNLIKIEGVINNAVYNDPSDAEANYHDSDTGYDNTDLTFTNGGDFDWEAFLQQQIEAGQDVEIAFSGTNIGGDETLAADQVCHMVTLMNIDSNTDGTGYWIQYLDPNNPTGGAIDAQFTINPATGEMSFLWDNDANKMANVTINEAWAESPVPLPAAVWGGLLLLAGMTISRRVRAVSAN